MNASLPVIAGALIVGAMAILSVVAPVPTIASPFALLSTLFVLIVFDMRMFDGGRLVSLGHVLAASPLALLFLIWNVQLFRREAHVPQRSLALYVTAAVLSVVLFVFAWSDGVRVQGATHTTALVLFNVFFVLVAGVALVWNRRSPAYASSLAFHVILFSWLAWGAFPWLGELI